MNNDINNIDDIKQLVDTFYTSVRNDALIGPIFSNVIGNAWQPHLDRMYAFWNAALFSVPGFKGNPFAKHAPLPITAQHFSRWLYLFNQTVDELFEGPVADDAKKRAELMAIMFQAKLGRMNDGFHKVIV
jgi:hemoglobin